MIYSLIFLIYEDLSTTLQHRIKYTINSRHLCTKFMETCVRSSILFYSHSDPIQTNYANLFSGSCNCL